MWVVPRELQDHKAASLPETDVYLQYFYDKDTVWAREKSTSLPDGTAAEKCLNDITGRWVEPW